MAAAKLSTTNVQNQSTREVNRPSIASFEVLVHKVRDTLLLGQNRIEQEKVRTYWKTGWYINRHVRLNQGRAELGGKVIQKLGERLKIHPTVLRRSAQFAEKYPECATWRKLTWSHFRSLIAVSDDRTRLELTRRADQGGRTTDKLESKIKLELRYALVHI